MGALQVVGGRRCWWSRGSQMPGLSDHLSYDLVKGGMTWVLATELDAKGLKHLPIS